MNQTEILVPQNIDTRLPYEKLAEQQDQHWQAGYGTVSKVYG